MKNIFSLLAMALLPACCWSQFPVDEGVAVDDSSIRGWGPVPELSRGPQLIDSSQLGPVTTGTPADAAGPADLLVVSLGEGGTATYTFDEAIGDGPGWDLALFENGFASGDGFFLELAFVEVSSDGERFVRFPASSLSDTAMQVGTFGLLYPQQIQGLAGKYEGLLGTPFDLALLADSAGLDVTAITQLRVVDIVGRIDEPTRDAGGRPINDPWPTPFESSGFDLDAVAYRYPAGTSHAGFLDFWKNPKIRLFPNPTHHQLFISVQGLPDADSHRPAEVHILDPYGRVVYRHADYIPDSALDLNDLPAGHYRLRLLCNGSTTYHSFIKY